MTLPYSVAPSDIILGFGQIVTLWVILRDGGAAKTKRVAAKAAAEATDEATLKALTSAIAELTTAVKELKDWAQSHENSDTDKHARTDEILKQQAALLEKLTDAALGAVQPTPLPSSRVRRAGS